MLILCLHLCPLPSPSPVHPPVPDRKQKGPARAASGADAAVVKELGRGLQASPAAVAAFLQQQAGLTGGASRCCLCQRQEETGATRWNHTLNTNRGSTQPWLEQ